MGNEQIAKNKIGLSAIIFIIYSLYYISGYFRSIEQRFYLNTLWWPFFVQASGIRHLTQASEELSP